MMDWLHHEKNNHSNLRIDPPTALADDFLMDGNDADIKSLTQMSTHTNFYSFLRIIAVGCIFGCIGFCTQTTVKWENLFRRSLVKQITPSNSLIQTLTLAEALRLFHERDTTFLDVREKRYFEYGRIEGAENLPPERLVNISSDQFNRWKAKRSLVLYCNGLGCGTAYFVAARLEALGFNNVSVYERGWPEWRSCHLPITMSPALKTKELTDE